MHDMSCGAVGSRWDVGAWAYSDGVWSRNVYTVLWALSVDSGCSVDIASARPSKGSGVFAGLASAGLVLVTVLVWASCKWSGGGRW